MTKIDIFSGFLGAGKTTLIKKLIKEAYAGEKVVLIENEFGEIGIDGGFMQEAGVNVTEMNSGCICCSLVGDFSQALQKVSAQYAPDRIIIEPSGVGKLSDVIKAVENAQLADGVLNAFCCVVDAGKCKMYMKNFGEFFNDQVEHAGCIVLSHTGKLAQEKLETAVALLKDKNQTATLITADWDSLDGKTILCAMERKESLQAELERLHAQVSHHHHEHECDDEECCCHGHHHEHHHDHEHGHGGHEHHHHEYECDDEECCCHGHHHEHHHDHEHGHGGHEHHHHEHECDDEECCCREHHHEHHHDHEHGHGGHEHHHHEHECDDEECCCHGHHHEHHHGHHHADEVFVSWGVETVHKFDKQALEKALLALEDEEKYGAVLRAKGIVAGDGSWLHFDYVPGEADVREGGAGVIGRLCVIGCKLNEDELKKLFNV